MLIGPGAAATQSAQALDLVLDHEEMAELISFIAAMIDQIDVESLPQAALESTAWGPAFQATGDLHQSYGDAQGEQQKNAQALRRDLEEFLIQLKKTRDDLDREDAAIAQQLARAGRTDHFQQAQQQRTQPPSAGTQTQPGPPGQE